MDEPESVSGMVPASADSPGVEFRSNKATDPDNTGVSALVLTLASLGLFLCVAAGLYFVLGTSDSGGEAEASEPAVEAQIRSERDEQAGQQPSSGGTGSAQPEVPVDGVSEVEHLGCPSDTAVEVCDAVAFVESSRGRPFKEFPSVSLQENDEFDRGLLADFDEHIEELEVQGKVLRSLGLIQAGDDLPELFRAVLEIGVVGYYDTDTGGLVVRGSDLDLYSQLVLVHELTHAHDDQWIGLDRPELEDAEGEVDFGFLAIQEGNASRVENEWRSLLSSADQSELDDLEASVISTEDLKRYLELPIFILQMQASPYVDGLALVEAIAGAGGEDAVDAAFDAPPPSSEQVLHPEMYLSADEAYLLSEPSVPGTVIDSGVFGELGFLYWLGNGAAQGWKADSYATWMDGDKACTRIDVEADTDTDLDELEDAAQSWARQGNDRETQTSGGVLTITGCA